MSDRRSALLPRTFYERSPDVVAPDLLGKVLKRRYGSQWLTGRISEIEAYLGERDPASHAYRGRTSHNDVLFGPPGYTYVYLIYGLHYCVNVSCLPDGEPGGVLIRAILPMEGIATMATLRRMSAAASVRLLTGGPGKVCQALAITRADSNGLDVTDPSSAVQIADDGYRPTAIHTTPRIGIRKAMDLPLRFLIYDTQAGK